MQLATIFDLSVKSVTRQTSEKTHLVGVVPAPVGLPTLGPEKLLNKAPKAPDLFSSSDQGYQMVRFSISSFDINLPNMNTKRVPK